MQPYFELYREFDRKISYIENRNDSFDPHFHSNIELLYVKKGEVEVTVRDQKRRLFAGDLAIASSYEPHGFASIGETVVQVFLFPSDALPDFTRMTEDYRLASSFLKRCSRTAEIVSLMERLRVFVDCEMTLTSRGYAYALLGILQEELGVSQKGEGRQSDLLIRQILLYIEEHFREAVSLSLLSKALGYHKDYLSKVFNARIGCGFSYYVNFLRARYARHLIHSGEKDLEVISFASGFQCMKSFRRAFLEHYGETPYECKRKRMQVS